MAILGGLSGGMRALIVGGVVAVAGAVAASALLFTSGKADEVNLTSANLVPEDAAVYVGLNTDLKSSQWVNAFAVAKKLGRKDPEQELKDSVTIGGLDWEDEVAPFLGGDAAVFLLTADLPLDDWDGGVVVKARDPGKALKVLRTQIVDRQGSTLQKRDYKGAAYEASDGEGYLARLGDHIVVTSSEATMKAVIDASKGGKSLGAGQAFRDVRDDLTGSFIVFSYVNPTKVTGGFFDDADTRKALERAGAGNASTSPFGGLFTATKEGFSFQAASKSTGSPNALWAQPRESKLIKLVPTTTAIFASTAGIADAWAQYSESRAQEFESLFGSDLFERNASRIEGNIDALIPLLTGEVAVAVWETSDGEATVLLGEVADEARVRAQILKTMRDQSPRVAVTNETVNGVQMTRVGDNAVAVRQGVAYMGSQSGVRQLLQSPAGDLLTSQALVHGRAALGAPLGTFVLLNLPALLKADRAEAIGFFVDDHARDALEGVIINIVNSGGFARLSAAVTVRE